MKHHTCPRVKAPANGTTNKLYILVQIQIHGGQASKVLLLRLRLNQVFAVVEPLIIYKNSMKRTGNLFVISVFMCHIIIRLPLLIKYIIMV